MSIERMFVDRGVSGSRPLTERKEGGALLEILAPGDVVFCAKLDRMFRSASDALVTLDALKARGVRLFLKDMGGDVTGNGVSALVFSILAAVAQFERERIRERVMENRDRLAAAGRFVGGRLPFGMMVEDGQDEDGRPARFLIEDPRAQASIKVMKKMRAEGDSFRAIQAAMKLQGVPVALATISKIIGGS
jgi:putative DNA-invertase from lambdoid prophage Rac